MYQLTDPEILRERLAKAGVHPRREAGQNFLISEEVVEATVAALQQWRRTAWRITELGAGLGTLTQALAAAGAEVRAIEWDRALAALLPEHIPPPRREHVRVVVQDLREADWTWTEPYILVGNIPYNVSGLILRRLTQLRPAPVAAVLLVQQEVAERVLASPPHLSLVGLAVQLWGEPVGLLRVPPNCFWPQPQVHSTLILISPHPDIEQSQEERERVLRVARVFFQAKRKQMGSVARRVFGLAADEVARRFSYAKIEPTQRPQELSVATWKRLAEVLEPRTANTVS